MISFYKFKANFIESWVAQSDLLTVPKSLCGKSLSENTVCSTNGRGLSLCLLISRYTLIKTSCVLEQAFRCSLSIRKIQSPLL